MSTLGGWAARDGVRTSARESKSSSPSSSIASAASFVESDRREKESAHWIRRGRRIGSGLISCCGWTTSMNSCLRVSAMCAWPRYTRRLRSFRDASSELFRREMSIMRFVSSVDSLRCLLGRPGCVGLLKCIEKGMIAEMEVWKIRRLELFLES